MSSKSHIICNHALEIYEETNESIYSFGRFVGFNIHLCISGEHIKTLIIKSDFVEIETSYGLHENVPLKYRILLIDVESIEFDNLDITITIRGGSNSANNIKEKIFNSF